MTNRPVVENAPGLAWRPIKDGWQARWQCRRDVADKGYRPTVQWLWKGSAPSPTEIAFIQDQCNRLQTEMLIWSRGGVPQIGAYDGTVAGLVDAYRTDKDSPYFKVRSKSRVHYDVLLKRVLRDIGSERVKELSARRFLRLYEQWSHNGTKPTTGHHYMRMMRILVNFGMTFLENDDCAKMSTILHKMRFQGGKPREERLTAEQADAIREMAHERGRSSIALGQAFQFDCLLRQKDVIGEWVPISEPGVSDILAGNSKSIRGLRWEAIDENLLLTHVTSKRQKTLVVPLLKAPMVVAELRRLYPSSIYEAEVFADGVVEKRLVVRRAMLPASGPVIINERLRLPYDTQEYRRQWRICADAVGVPKAVKNMDSRAGGITEATEAGADIEHVKHAATHGNISMTQRYSRGATEKIAGVMDKRAAHRKGRKE